jgi:16S rRNA (adenine1518-N6/adenine1519-N6)-dimethyltransferase
MTLTEVRRLLAELGILPSRAMGQNFLIDSNILAIIIEQARIRPDETVIEVGSGLGVLTAELIARAGRVIAIEKDRRLCAYLREQFPFLELVEGDAVKVLHPTSFIFPPSYKVVANLPYSISTPILERFVEAPRKPRAMVVTLQREVAARLAARPGTKEYGALTLLTQVYYHATVAHVVSPRCFYPSPRVESAVVVLERRDPRVTPVPGARFADAVRAGFEHRRKMLKKQLTGFGEVEKAFAQLGIQATVRAEELNLDQWIALANALATTKPCRGSSAKN